MGAILTPGRRTVSSALRAMGLDRHKRFHRYHRVLSHASWSSLKASRVLLGLLIEAFVAEEGPLLVGIDETLVHPQRGLCVMSYSGRHEASNLRTFTFGNECENLQAGLRSKDAFVMRRCQILLASSRGQSSPKIARSLGCGSQTVRNAIHDFNDRGLPALTPGSSRPKRVHAAFDKESAEALREMLHRSPREFGYESSLWTLEMAAEAAFEEGLTETRVSGETVRATLVRLLGVRWMWAKRWITSPEPLYERKKGGATD